MSLQRVHYSLRFKNNMARTFMKKIVMGLLLLLSCAAIADDFVIKDIRVEGLQRISAGTVFNLLPVKVGDQLSDQSVPTIIRALYQSKYFDDVQLEEVDNVLVVTVKERPAISSIEIIGNKDIDNDQLLKSLRQVGFAEGQVFEQAQLENVKLMLQREYFNRGKYGVEVESQVTPLSRNRVAIRVSVVEGEVATIGKINIVGNTHFSEEDLLDEFESTTGDMLSRFTHNDQYSRQKLAADLETLRSFYLDRGFVDFDVESTQVSITADKKKMFITINIAEGERYQVSEVRLAGNLIVPEEELFESVTVAKDSVFSRKELTTTTKKITDRIGDEGYAFANVNAIPDIDRENHLVKITFFVDPGRRAYVRRINISGNSKTRDEVLRREFRQQESAWMSTTKVAESRSRVKRLGYFSEVDVETVPVPGTTDQVDLDFNVVEQSSGNFSIGFGFSQEEGFLFNSNITQKNFLGSGQHLRFGFNNSRVNRVYSIGLTDPFSTIDGISQGFDAFFRTTDAREANLATFNTDTWGGNYTFGIPISEDNRISLGFGYENTDLTLSDTLEVQRYKDFVAAEGDSFDAFTLNLGWTSDSRDSAILPTKGMRQSISAEVAIPGGDLQYYKVRYSNKWFHPLSKTLVFALKANLGYGDSYGDTSELPFFQNFYAGGIRSVRGYEANTLGVKENERALGGNLLVTGGAEVIFPIPFVKKALRSFRLSAFVDVGNVFDVDEDFDTDSLRYSAGLSAIWLSPFGAMSFSVAEPFNDQPGDFTETVQFSLGTTF